MISEKWLAKVLFGNRPEQEIRDIIPSDDVEEAQIRDNAQHAAAVAQATLSKVQEETAAMGRWTLATLLAMNSGAVASVLAGKEAIDGPIGAPILAFSIGAFFAVSVGINGQLSGMRAGTRLGAFVAELRFDAIKGIIRADTLQQREDLLRFSAIQIFWSAMLAAGSLLSFAVGVLLAVI